MGRGALAGVVLALCLAAPAAAAPGPKLRTPAKQLNAALTCAARFTHPAHEPVLLVHGTATNTADSWSWNYAAVLPALGYDVCAVDIPGRELGTSRPRRSTSSTPSGTWRSAAALVST